MPVTKEQFDGAREGIVETRHDFFEGASFDAQDAFRRL